MRRQVVTAVLALALASAAGLGCAPQVRMTALHAAQVQVPAEIVRLGAAPPVGEGADVALAGLREQLERSDRFVWVGAAEADAVVSVQAGERVSELDEDEVFAGWRATRTARIGVTWELRTHDDRVLDLLEAVAVVDRWTGEAPTVQEATAAIVTPEEASRSLFWSAGAAYARRIAPLEQRLARRLRLGGDPRLGRGHYALMAGSWDEAVRLWSEVSRAAHRAEVRSRADHNLAVAFELRGQTRRALDLVDRSLAGRASSRTARYRESLSRAAAEARTLRWAEPGLQTEER